MKDNETVGKLRCNSFQLLRVEIITKRIAQTVAEPKPLLVPACESE